LIFSTQSHPVLISLPLSLSQKELEANLSREQKNAAVFANRISWRNHDHFTHSSSAVSTTNVRHQRKKSLLLML